MLTSGQPLLVEFPARIRLVQGRFPVRAHVYGNLTAIRVIVEDLNVGVLSATGCLCKAQVEYDPSIHAEEVWELRGLKEHTLRITLWQVSLLENVLVEGLKGRTIESAWLIY